MIALAAIRGPKPAAATSDVARSYFRDRFSSRCCWYLAAKPWDNVTRKRGLFGSRHPAMHFAFSFGPDCAPQHRLEAVIPFYIPHKFARSAEDCYDWTTPTSHSCAKARVDVLGPALCGQRVAIFDEPLPHLQPSWRIFLAQFLLFPRLLQPLAATIRSLTGFAALHLVLALTPRCT